MQGLQNVLNVEGDDAASVHVGNHHHVADKDYFRLLAVLRVLADEGNGFLSGVGVLTQMLGGRHLHLHLEQLIVAAKGLKLGAFSLVALTFLLFARIGNFADTVAIGLVLIDQFAHIQLVFLH